MARDFNIQDFIETFMNTRSFIFIDTYIANDTEVNNLNNFNISLCY